MADPTPQLPGTMIVQDPFDAAMAAFQQTLVDLDGDGRPDAVVNVGNRERQAMARRAMAGREPVLSQREQQDLYRRAMVSEGNNQALERGVGEVVLGQPMRATNALMKAYHDPSLASLTNAGVQTALAVPTARGAMTAATIGGAGLGMGAAQDMGLLTSPAEAGPGDRDRARAAREQAAAERARADAARANAEAARAAAAARNTETESNLKESEQRLKEERDRIAMAENEAAVKRAIAARDTILNDRPRKFSETRTGQVFDELGMIAPAIPAALAGGLAGSGLRAAGAGHKAVTATGIGVGGMAGGLAGNWPLGHELMVARAYNPEKEAYKAGAREMPASDQRKREWTDYAASLPDENPARRVALNELLDIPMTLKRSALPIGEGMAAGWGAVDLPGAIGRTIGRVRGTGPGSTGGPTMGPGGAGGQSSGGATPQAYRTYLDLPPDVRQRLQAEYVSQRALSGSDLPVGRTAQAVKGDLAGQGIDVPVTSARVSATNKVISDFVAQYGRLPTAQEFSQVFNRNTLAIPLTIGGAGAAAGSVNDLLSYYQGG